MVTELTYINISKEDRQRVKVLAIKNGIKIPDMLKMLIDNYENR